MVGRFGGGLDACIRRIESEAHNIIQLSSSLLLRPSPCLDGIFLIHWVYVFGIRSASGSSVSLATVSLHPSAYPFHPWS